LIQESTSYAQPQQQEKHVLYYEKRDRFRKKAPTMQQPIAQKQGPAQRPFVPPKKKQRSSSEAIGQSSSQPRRETIRIYNVVTKSVPKEGRIKWFL